MLFFSRINPDFSLEVWANGKSGLMTHPVRKQLFEIWVVSECLKYRCNNALPSNFYFWCDSTGCEVDILIEQVGKLLSVEIKSVQTIVFDFFDSHKKFQKLTGDSVAQVASMYGGTQGQHRETAKVVPGKNP